jgi:uncharacterized DUF497 family protein
MTELHFEWDPRKAAANAAKHGVTFKEAKTVFYDESAGRNMTPSRRSCRPSGALRSSDPSAHALRCAARRAGTKEQKPYKENKS